MFADVPRDARIFQEEIFGPVVAVAPFDSEDEAVELANESKIVHLALAPVHTPAFGKGGQK